MKLTYKKIFFNYLLTTKLPFRLFALTLILFLFLVTIVVTYKAGIDILSFFKINYSHSQYVKNMLLFVSISIGITTIVQSAPIIWDKLSYWGQVIDNYLLELLFNKKYFIFLINQSINNIRESLNQINLQLQKYEWNYALCHYKVDHRQQKEINDFILTNIKNIIQQCYSIMELLNENEPSDNISRMSKANADMQLNILITQVTDMLVKLRSLNKK